ncbi:MAG: adenylate/guanylate cyclase domain-containing protein [Bacteroidia bacterium]
MPNLRQLVALQKKYNKVKPSGLHGFTLKRLEKSFSFVPNAVIDSEISDCFDKRKKYEVVLLYIDIADFTKQYGNLQPIELSDFLDRYYNTVVPIIYEYGGEVERLTGDGIICVFGEPFSDEEFEDEIFWAFICAQKIVHTCCEAGFPVKIAYHFGEVMYYSPPTENFQEYTMIGNTLTELYRLESVSEVNAISFYWFGIQLDLCVFNYVNKTRKKWIHEVKNKDIQNFGNVKLVFLRYNANNILWNTPTFEPRYVYW